MSIARASVNELSTRRPRRRRSRWASLDWPLLIGLFAVGVLLFVALYGPLLAPSDPWEARTLYQGKVPPFDPGPDYPLGSDAIGRDRLSWLLYGARATFVIALAAAAIRLFIGVTLGVAAAWRGGRSDQLLSRLAIGLSSMPATIAAVLAVIAFNVNGGIWSFVLGLSVVGWADAFQHARRAARAEAAKPHIDSARSLGLTERRLIVRHLMPNLAPSLLTIGSLQISAVLLLLAELALIRIFFGGALSTGLSGSYALAPSQPEWASTLAATRPIFDLYGNAISVLAPGGALLFAVISFNLFGDALARRAQRLDIFHLFSARQWLMLAAATVAIATPAVLWPSPLADDIAYANRFDATRALSIAQELAGLDRVQETPGAAAAASRLAELLGTALTPIKATVPRTQSLTLTSGGRVLSLGPGLAGLSPASGAAHGEAVLVEPTAGLVVGRLNAALKDRIVFLRDVRATPLSAIYNAMSRAAVAGVVIVSDDAALASDPVYALVPTIRASTEAVRQLLGQDLPAWPGDRTLADPTLPVSLGASVDFDLRVAQVPVAATNAILRIPAKSAGTWPLIVVSAAYDVSSTSLAIRRAETASASAALAAVAEAVRTSPLDAEILIVAAGAQSLDNVGLRSALQALSPDDQQRLVAVVSIQSALTRDGLIRPDASDTNPGGGPTVAGRVASAVGQQIAPQASPALLRALLAAGVRAPTFEITGSDGLLDSASVESLNASGRSVLALLHYVARHPEKLRP